MKISNRNLIFVTITDEEFYKHFVNRLLIGKITKVKNNTKINGIVDSIRKNTSNVRILNSNVIANKDSEMAHIDECLKNW